jgi:hypothetical protein
MWRGWTAVVVSLVALLISGCATISGGARSVDTDLVSCRQQLSGEISRLSVVRLREVAADLRAQRQTLAEVEGFVGWMSTNLSGCAKYVEAGKVVTAIARVLPIPYAGQASLFTKFASSGLLSLNSASVSLNHYLTTSQQFIAKVDGLGPTPSQAAVTDAVSFADGTLLRDMNDARGKLARTAELSASTLAFLEALQAYTRSTDEYISKTKSLFRRDDDHLEKGFLTENIGALRSRITGFDGRLRHFEESSKRCELAIKSVVGYGELAREMTEGASRNQTSAGLVRP